MELNLGWMGAPLAEQLGVEETDKLKRLDNIRNAVLTLHMTGYIPDSQMTKCFRKLTKEIDDYLKEK